MTDPENHLDQARSALDDARAIYGDTPSKFAVIENALMGIGHALLAIHDQLVEGGGLDPDTEALFRKLHPELYPELEPPADISGIPLDTPEYQVWPEFQARVERHRHASETVTGYETEEEKRAIAKWVFDSGPFPTPTTEPPADIRGAHLDAT